MKNFARLFALAVLSVAAISSRADLTGSQVTGTFNASGVSTNLYDASFGFVPSGFGNSAPGVTTVTIGSGTEFGFDDGYTNNTANFSGTGLLLTDNCDSGTTCNSNGLTFTFSDPMFLGASIVSNTLGVTSSFSGNTLTINFPDGGLIANGSAVVDFDISSGGSSVTPEPGTFALLGTGVLGAAGALRRKLRV